MDIEIALKQDGMSKHLTKMKGKIGFAVSKSLNDAMTMTRNQLVEKDTQKYLENVVPFSRSRGALMVKYTNKRNIRGGIYIPKNRPYLEWVIFGGTSVPYKPGQEHLYQPINARLNKYQNIPRTYVSTRKDKPNFFLGRPYRKGDKKDNPTGVYGLWERTKGKRKLHVLIENKSRKQNAIFPADDLARKYMKHQFGKEFRRNMWKEFK